MVSGNKITRLFLIVLLFVFCSTQILAMSATPAIVTVTYDPNEGVDTEFEVFFSSTVNPPGYADISLLGGNHYAGFAPLSEGIYPLELDDVNKYFTINKNELDLSKDRKVRVTVKIPPHANILGPHEFGIMGTQRVEGASEGMFIVTTSVIIRVRIESPYPGQYVDINNFGISSVNEGESSDLFWQVKGRGQMPTPFTASVELFSDKNISLFQKSLGNGVVELLELYPEDSSKAFMQLPTNTYSPGIYRGVLTVKFSNETKTREVYFQVGEEKVAIDAYTSKLTQGEINSISITVRNLWNGRFENVHAIIDVNGVRTTTPSGTLSPFETIVLNQYLDTRTLDVGNYTFNVTVNYGSKSMIFPLNFEIVQKEIPQVVEDEKKPNTILFVVIGALILISIVLFFIIKHKKRGK